MEIATHEEELAWASEDSADEASAGMRAAVRRAHAAYANAVGRLIQRLNVESDLARRTSQLIAHRAADIQRVRTSTQDCVTWTARFDSADLCGLVRRYVALLRELRACIDVAATEAGAMLDPQHAPSADDSRATLGRTASSGIDVDNDGATVGDNALAGFAAAVRGIAIARGDAVRQHAADQKASASVLATTIAGTMATRVEALVRQLVAENAARVPETTVKTIVHAVSDTLQQARSGAEMTIALCAADDDNTAGVVQAVREAPKRVLECLRRYDAQPPPPPRPVGLSEPSSHTSPPGPKLSTAETGRPSGTLAESRQHLREAGRAYNADASRRRERSPEDGTVTSGEASPRGSQAGGLGIRAPRPQPRPSAGPTGRPSQQAAASPQAQAAAMREQLRRQAERQAQQLPQASPPGGADGDDDPSTTPKRHNIFNLFGLL
uniref:Uncharacterized protein n=1 Tax=Neobodo designis TaxID=312471 RepID=A0A7S1R1F9_NEODS|mmetsp:Transcript_6677/g.20967  ORF Transcript_6677/g.20967 Transcript_6677/m.20967 type:complete len:439 (+) Transcript_6677:48-1364(+)|eukprot:CAMPEP_0174829222 /NCGR_PEP_ID=MMETSP1114-20130205/1807_1 /TAXON_ID=312471 /ORGANISM="Neobodo designis, Strain CCAP 1951/1" /LENGTH=438 /DNA_ID=CAMNT_0016062967 /DNA_START=47 /DNA_END=1363 /DNA_ORIENTATION=-